MRIHLHPLARRIAAWGGTALIVALIAGPVSAGDTPTVSPVSDSTDVVAAVHRFHAALAAGDSAAVAALLTADVAILESGGVETRAQYLGGHLKGDMAYAQAVPSERGPMTVLIKGDVAWASSTSSTKGEYRGRAVNSVGAELVVLVRGAAGWQIAAIHWSSRAIRPPAD